MSDTTEKMDAQEQRIKQVDSGIPNQLGGNQDSRILKIAEQIRKTSFEEVIWIKPRPRRDNFRSVL